jgi:hypothetical protein
MDSCLLALVKRVRTVMGTAQTLWMCTQLVWGLGMACPGRRKSGGYWSLTRSVPSNDRKSRAHFSWWYSCLHGGRFPLPGPDEYAETVVINTWVDPSESRRRTIAGSMDS